MKTSSAKNKGRRLQNYVVSLIHKYFNGLHADDVKGASMGQTGEDILLSEKARGFVPFSIECKNQERLSFWKAWEQAKGHKYTPLLVVKKNKSDCLVVVEADVFFQLLQTATKDNNKNDM